MFDGVPWAVENGARCSAAVARAAHYAATRGAEGVALPGDLKVTQTIPGASQGVRIASGSATILNAQAPGESYQGLARSDTDVPITVDGTARHDLVIAQIIDPDFPPWQTSDVPDAVNGPYFLPHVIPGVDPSTSKLSDVESYSGYALALVDVPATGNITDSMIHNLRELAQPRTWSTTDVQVAPANGGQPNYLTTAQTSWTDWPLNNLAVEVPKWAVKMTASIMLNQLQIDNAGNFDARVNVSDGALTLTGVTANFDYNPPNANPDGMVVGIPFSLYTEMDVTDLQGESVIIKPQAQRTFADTATGNIWMGSGTSPTQQVVFDVRFYETVV